MRNRKGPAECDAPPYRVVEACADLGFEAPLDVRWCRANQNQLSSSTVGIQFWRGFFGGTSRPDDNRCACGGPMPLLEHYTFTFASLRVARYLLGQCPRCRAIHWREV
jgi:hypothetical protein